MSRAAVARRLAELRQALRRHEVAALIVNAGDPHLSEYPAEHWKVRQWLSGFTGSVGTLVVTSDRAALFVDGRYRAQAQRQLAGSGIELVEHAVGSGSAPLDWLVATLAGGGTVAADGRTLALALAEQWRQRLRGAGLQLRTDLDLIDALWGAERPPLPDAPVFVHAPPWADLTVRAKLQAVRGQVAGAGASHHLLSTLDDVAWLSNLRGSDVSYNPVFMAHLLIERQRATLFVDTGKLPPPVRAELAEAGIDLAPYEAVAAALGRIDPTATVLLDPARVTEGLRAALPASVRVVAGTNPSTLQKSRKTAREIEHIRATMVEDGAAMCEFYAWLEDALAGGERVTEVLVHRRLAQERARRAGFVGLSFHTVAAFNAHAAMPHYQADGESDALIEGDGLLLIDSGAQYLGGTTDVTRVWPVGRISAAQRRDCTLVLKAMLGLSRARFPRGTPGPMLDALARAPLWAEGLDYAHGTGHGVGYFLNVHEGPQTIARVTPDAGMAIEPGMLTSIEPGVYRDGCWGVRIENLVLARPAEDPAEPAFAQMLEFETLTLCPIDTRCLLPALLRPDELDWLNGYHDMVRARLAPRLSPGARHWLQRRTERL